MCCQFVMARDGGGGRARRRLTRWVEGRRRPQQRSPRRGDSSEAPSAVGRAGVRALLRPAPRRSTRRRAPERTVRPGCGMRSESGASRPSARDESFHRLKPEEPRAESNARPGVLAGTCAVGRAGQGGSPVSLARGWVRRPVSRLRRRQSTLPPGVPPAQIKESPVASSPNVPNAVRGVTEASHAGPPVRGMLCA